MITIRHISSLDAEDLRPYRTLRQSLAHREQGIFVAEGEKVVARLLESGFTVLTAMMTPAMLEMHRHAIEQRPETVVVYIAPQELLSTIVGYELHQCIMAVGRVPVLHTPESLLPTLPGPWFTVAVDGIVSAENLGVLVRNCAGLGVQALIVGESSSSPFLRRAVRNSMGAVFQVPIIDSRSLKDTLMSLRTTYGMTLIAAHPHSNGTAIYDLDLSGNVCIIFGNEGNGISGDVLALCDVHAEIPMHADTDSLNVASASAAFLAEVQRQRRAAGGCL